MSFFSKMFGKRDAANDSSTSKTEVSQSALGLAGFLERLLSSDAYIARSQYLKRLEEDKALVSYLNQLNASVVVVQ